MFWGPSNTMYLHSEAHTNSEVKYIVFRRPQNIKNQWLDDEESFLNYVKSKQESFLSLRLLPFFKEPGDGKRVYLRSVSEVMYTQTERTPHTNGWTYTASANSTSELSLEWMPVARTASIISSAVVNAKFNVKPHIWNHPFKPCRQSKFQICLQIVLNIKVQMTLTV